MARTNPHVISTRVDNATARRVRTYCASRGITASDAARMAITLVASGALTRTAAAYANDDLDRVVREVAQALGLPPGTTADEVAAALDDLLETLRAEPPAPASEVADPPPGGLLAAARRLGWLPPAGAPRAHAAPVRPLKRDEVAACKRLGITETEFRARKAKAVRRAPDAPKRVSASAHAPVSRRPRTTAESRACARLGIDADEFARRKAAAVRRV